MEKSMIKIYGSDLSSPANKVRYIANYLNLKYEYIHIKLREGEHRKKEFLQLNPSGKIPIINDDGFIVVESNAICKYLCNKEKSPLYPHDYKKQALVDQWVDFITLHVGSAMNRIAFNKIFVSLLKTSVDEQSLADGLKFFARFMPIVDNKLKKHEYVCGDDITLADFVLLATLDAGEMSGLDMGQYSNVERLRSELKKQDFYTQCHKKYGESLE
jgi:glutathione S-transferase